jgi:hypothetical protein
MKFAVFWVITPEDSRCHEHRGGSLDIKENFGFELTLSYTEQVIQAHDRDKQIQWTCTGNNLMFAITSKEMYLKLNK